MVKMRINKDEHARCDSCNNLCYNVEELYDIAIGDKISTICRNCSNTLFQKLLKASCAFDSRVKSKEDIARINRAKVNRSKKMHDK